MTSTLHFAERLNTLKKENGLTASELAKRAGVPKSLISGLCTGNRVIGECSARKIGQALQLSGTELENFVYLAINNCSEKVLNASKEYPAEVINLLAGELYSLGISPDTIIRCVRKPAPDAGNAFLHLNDGKVVRINLEVANT